VGAKKKKHLVTRVKRYRRGTLTGRYPRRKKGFSGNKRNSSGGSSPVSTLPPKECSTMGGETLEVC